MITIKNVGFYSHARADNETCKLCHNVESGDVLIYGYDLEGEGICGKCLLHHYDSTKGLWVTDKPEMITENQKKVFWQL